MQFKFGNLKGDLMIDTKTEAAYQIEGLRVGLFGAPGSTKSYTAAAVFVEQFLKQGGTLVLFQPLPEWHTLKSAFPEVQVVGGPRYPDMPFIPSHPELYAKAVVHDRISMVFTTTGIEEELLVHFIDQFFKCLIQEEAEALLPVMVVLEEAHDYAPLKPQGKDWTQMIRRCKELWTRGRKLNIVPIAISQRPQEVNFTIRQNCNVTLYGKFSPQDINYIDTECLAPFRRLGIDVASEDLLTLKPGEFLMIAQGSVIPIRRTIGRITPHGADTPVLDSIPIAPANITKSFSALGDSLRRLLEEEEEEEKETAVLRKALREKEAQLKEANDKMKTGLHLVELLRKAGQGASTPEDIEKAMDKLREEIAERDGTIVALRSEKERVLGLTKEVDEYRPLLEAAERFVRGMVRKEVADYVDAHPPSSPTPAIDRTVRANLDAVITNAQTPEPARKVLSKFKASLPGMRYRESDFGYSIDGGTWKAAKSWLTNNCLIAITNDGWWGLAGEPKANGGS